MTRTTLAIALATGALAVPAVAFATGGDDTGTQQAPQTAPVQQEQQQPPDRGDCPEHDGSGGGSSGSDTAPTPSPESGGSGSGDTLL